MIKKIFKIIAITFLIGILAIAGVGYYILFYPNTSFQEQQRVFYIPSGSDYSYITEKFYTGLSNPTTFYCVARAMKYTEHVRAGRYVIRKGMNNLQLVRMLRNLSQPVKVSFNNQDRLPLLAQRISKEIEADSTSLMNAFLNPSFLAESGTDSLNILGHFIPNTYEFYWDTSAKTFAERMEKEYKAFWNEKRREKATAQGLTPEQVIILASIVQKETYMTDERPTIAGVYLNRLKERMPLQADPTVVYAIKETTGNYDTIIKRVYIKDTQIVSPYNTYQIQGLPPAPIAMPDISSIEAVLSPKEHEYLFFVADTARIGYHKFARTLQEHNKNRQAYRKWLDKRLMTNDK